MTKTSSKETLKKKLEEGRKRNVEIAGVKAELYKKPIITYLITVFSDGTIKADRVINPALEQQPPPPKEENKNEEGQGEEHKPI